MRIHGSNGESIGDVNGEIIGDVNGEIREDVFNMDFFTPQHQARSPAQSYFSIQNSQDSIDVYHDACSTLGRNSFQSGFSLGERKRHVSLCEGALENGDHFNGEFAEDYKETTDMIPKGPQTSPAGAGRVRHSSCSTVGNRFRSATFTGSSPGQIGRLSLSSNSLRKKIEVDFTDKPNTRKTSSFQRLARGNGLVNYVPCSEMSELVENSSVEHAMNSEPDPINRDPYPEKPPINDTWMKNYVTCIETEQMLGQPNGHDASPLEIQLCPEKIEQENERITKMYSFQPVEQRRVGLKRLRDEFKSENLQLHHKAPHLFVTSQWQHQNRMSCLYLGYRLFWAIYFCMWAIWAWVGSMGYDADISQKKYFMLYMTNWGLWTLAVDTTLQAIIVILHCKKISEEGDSTYASMPQIYKISWVLSNITGAVHIFITLAYWITVYPFREDEHLNEIGVNTHIMPGLYTLLNIAVSATPRKLLHVYQPAAFLCVYMLFNLVYYLCGGLDYLGRPALYPVLDWTRPGSTIGIIAAVLLFVIPLLHFSICGLYAIRLKVWRSLKLSRYMREDGVDQTEQAAQEQKV